MNSKNKVYPQTWEKKVRLLVPHPVSTAPSSNDRLSSTLFFCTSRFARLQTGCAITLTHELFFSQTFSGTAGRYPGGQTSWDIPPKKFAFPGLSKDIPNFSGPHPFTAGRPSSRASSRSRRYPDQEVWVWVLFSSLILGKFLVIFCTQLPATTRRNTRSEV